MINQKFLYLFGGYPLSNCSIEMFYDKFMCWKPIQIQDGDHYMHSFWAGAYLSDNMDGSIFIFGGGLKYNDTQECFDFNADNKSIRKSNITLPTEDRFFYNQQQIRLAHNKIVVFGRHGVYKMDFGKSTCFKIERGYRDFS